MPLFASLKPRSPPSDRGGNTWCARHEQGGLAEDTPQPRGSPQELEAQFSKLADITLDGGKVGVEAGGAGGKRGRVQKSGGGGLVVV